MGLVCLRERVRRGCLARFFRWGRKLLRAKAMAEKMSGERRWARDALHCGYPFDRFAFRRGQPMFSFVRTSALVALCSVSLGAQTRVVTQAEVDRITREAILIDTHDDVPSKTVDGYDIATPNKGGQTDLARMKGFSGGGVFCGVCGGGVCEWEPFGEPGAGDDRYGADGCDWEASGGVCVCDDGG